MTMVKIVKRDGTLLDRIYETAVNNVDSPQPDPISITMDAGWSDGNGGKGVNQVNRTFPVAEYTAEIV